MPRHAARLIGGEISMEETVYQAIGQRGESYDLPIAVGDKVRLFSKTYARFEAGPKGYIGSNGNIVTVVERRRDGLRLRNQDGRTGFVSWDRLKERKTGKLHLGFGHALTIDSAQGITSGEHINALPRGTAGITAFKTYVAESRHIGQAYTMIAEASLLEAVKMRQALGETTAITTDDLWKRAAADMSESPTRRSASTCSASDRSTVRMRCATS